MTFQSFGERRGMEKENLDRSEYFNLPFQLFFPESSNSHSVVLMDVM